MLSAKDENAAFSLLDSETVDKFDHDLAGQDPELHHYLWENASLLREQRVYWSDEEAVHALQDASLWTTEQQVEAYYLLRKTLMQRNTIPHNHPPPVKTREPTSMETNASTDRTEERQTPDLPTP